MFVFFGVCLFGGRGGDVPFLGWFEGRSPYFDAFSLDLQERQGHLTLSW